MAIVNTEKWNNFKVQFPVAAAQAKADLIAAEQNNTGYTLYDFDNTVIISVSKEVAKRGRWYNVDKSKHPLVTKETLATKKELKLYYGGSKVYGDQVEEVIDWVKRDRENRRAERVEAKLAM